MYFFRCITLLFCVTWFSQVYCIRSLSTYLSTALGENGWIPNDSPIPREHAFSQRVPKLVATGLILALKECQHQFKWDKWNCPNSAFSIITDPQNVTGFAFGMCYIPSLVFPSSYFKKYLPFAMCCTEVGASVGPSLMSLLISFLIDKYTWRGSMFIISGICLQSAVLGSFLRPHKSIENTKQTHNAHTRKKDHVPELDSNQTNINRILANEQYVNEGYECNKYIMNVMGSNKSSISAITIASDRNSIVNGENEKKRCLKPDDCKGTILSNSSSPIPNCFKVKQYFKTYVKFVKNLSFIVFSVSCFLFGINIGIFYTFVPTFLTRIGIHVSDVSILITLAYAIEGPASVITGILSNVAFINRQALHTVAIIMVAITFPLYTFMHTYEILAVFLSVFGLCKAVMFALRVVIIMDLVGKEDLTEAMGIVSMLSGAGALCGPPIGGYLIDLTGSFDAMFYCACIVQSLSAMVMLITPLKNCLMKQKLNITL